MATQTQPDFGNETPGADAIANELLRNELRNLCESVYSSLNMKGGDRAFDHFCAQVTQVIDEYACPTDVAIEKVAVFDHISCDAIFDGAKSDNEGQEISFDQLLDELDKKCCTDSKKMQRRLSRRVQSERPRRLDGRTLDPLAKLMDEIPDENLKVMSSRRKARKKKYRDDTDSESTEPEDFSTRPLAGTRRMSRETSMPVEVFNFSKLAKEMEKGNRQSTVRMSRARTSNTSATEYGSHSPVFPKRGSSKKLPP